MLARFVGYVWILLLNVIFPNFLILKLLQEAAALAATEVAFMLQAGQHRGLQFRIAPGPAATPHQEPLQ